MSSNLQNLLRDALLNNSYDYNPMHDTLKNTWINSYSYLYFYQKAKIAYEELFYYSNDVVSRDTHHIGHLYLRKTSAAFDIDYDIIDMMSREEYRKSGFVGKGYTSQDVKEQGYPLSKTGFYNKEFTVEDMTNNPHIFSKIPIVIIDDKVIFDFKIKLNTDSATFILPFGRSFVYTYDRKSPSDDQFTYLDHKVQVLIIDNIYYQRFTYNKSTILFNIVNKTITLTPERMMRETETKVTNSTIAEMLIKFNKSTYSQLNEKELGTLNKTIAERMEYYKLPEQTGIMFTSLHFVNDAGRGYYLGTAPIELEKDENGNYVGKLTDDIVAIIKDHRYNIYASVWFVQNLHKHVFYDNNDYTISDSGTKLMVLEESHNVPFRAPVPIENFMVFKQNTEGSGWYLEKNTDMLTLYYPNIYKNKDNTIQDGAVYKYYYFFFDENVHKYTVMFDFYYRFLSDIFVDTSMEEIINNIYYDRADLPMYDEDQKETFKNVFNTILNYSAFHFQYGDIDFIERYLKSEEKSDYEPIEYKDEVLKEWIKEEPWVLHNYELRQNKLGSSYHLFTNTIDLASRLRYSTEQELGTKNIYHFDEPRYVFAFANTKQYPALLDCRVFCDGLLVGDVYQRRKNFMDYFYIPAASVTNDSYIELEIFPRYEFRKDMQFNSMDPVEVTIAEPEPLIYPTAADLMFWEDSDVEVIANVTWTDDTKIGLDGISIHDTRFAVGRIDLDDEYTGIESIFWVDTNYEKVIPDPTKPNEYEYVKKPEYAVYAFYDASDNLLATANSGLYNTFYKESSFRCFFPILGSGSVKTIRMTILKTGLEDITLDGNPSNQYEYIKVQLRRANSWGPMYNYKTRYSSDWFKIVAKYDRGEFEVKTTDPEKPVKFARLSTFTIQPKDPYVLWKPMTMTFTKIPAFTRCTMHRAGYAMIELQTDDFQFSGEYIRIFRNGRLLPEHRWRLLTNYERPRIFFNIWFDIGDILYIDITPFRYTKILHINRIDVNHAVIDLKGIINKPFDVKYFDIYMNGRRLSINNVFMLDPWTITLVNLKSGYNVDIYEKERDWEYFGVDYNTTTYYFPFESLVNSGLLDDNEYNKLVADRIEDIKDERLNIYPNTDDEIEMNYDDIPPMIYMVFHIFYFDELVSRQFVNPDIKQYDKELMITDFKELYELYRLHPCDEEEDEYDFNRRKNYPEALCLDPDIYIKAPDKDPVAGLELHTDNVEVYDEDNNLLANVDYNDDNTDYHEEGGVLTYNFDDEDITNTDVVEAYNSMLVFEVGHTTDVPQEYLDDRIRIPTHPTITRNEEE